jgi:hypothetical protein
LQTHRVWEAMKSKLLAMLIVAALLIGTETAREKIG